MLTATLLGGCKKDIEFTQRELVGHYVEPNQGG